MNLRNTLKRYQHKYYAPGSPFRVIRKALLEVTNPGASNRRSKLGGKLTADLPESTQKIVTKLDATGYADGAGEIDLGLLTELTAAADAKMGSGADHEKRRSFFTQLTDKQDLTVDSIWVRFALQPGVQKLVSAYFDNSVPYLCDVGLLLSTGTEEDKWSESQLWHLDYADSRTIKLWVYLSDVTDVENGPFTYIPVEPSRNVPNSFFPGRVSDETMEKQGLTSSFCQVYGRKQKVFYIDTSRCYHLGSRLRPGQHRLAYIATFVTHKPLYPLANGIKTNGQLGEVEKCLLEL